MHQLDEQAGRRWRFGLASFVLSAAIALALALPALASAGSFILEVEKEGIGEGTVISSPAGIGCGFICEAEFEEGKEVTLTASADAESEFVEWEGCDTEPEGKCKVTMSGPRTVIAVFEEAELPEYSLEINEAGNGEGEWECVVGGEEEFCEDEYPAGTHVTIKSTPYQGSKFTGFTGDCTGTSCNLVMDKDRSITLTFTLLEFTLTVKQNGTGKGTVECELEEGPEPCKSKYPWETSVILIATPEPGSEFVEWQGCDRKPEPAWECEVYIEEVRSVLATFNEEPSGIKYTLSIEREGTGSGTVTSEPAGIDCGIDCAEEFPEKEKVTLIAVPDEGSVFKRWTNAAGSCAEEAVCWTTMGASKTVKATFAGVGYTLTVQREGTGSGTVTSSPAGISCGADCTEGFPEGQKVALTATPDAGSEFKRWSGVSGSCATEAVCWTTMGASKTVKANFASTESPETKGRAKLVRRVALVRGRRALLKVRCVGGPCKGVLKLVARVQKGKGKRNLTIGRRSLSLAPGARRTLKVKLSRPARRELAKRGRLKAKMRGGAVFASLVKLKSARR